MQNRKNKSVEIDITGSTLYLDLTNFTGDDQAAVSFVEDFCRDHKVRYVNDGREYANLMIDNETHDISPYGIDLNIMIGFCGKNASDFPLQQTSLTAAIAVAGGSPILSTRAAQSVSVSEFLAAAADGDMKIVEQYLRQNPEGKPDGDIENPFDIAKQLASLRESNTTNRVLNMLEMRDLKRVSPASM